MKITGLPLAGNFKASTLAEKYQIEIAQARALKRGLEVEVDDACAERLVADLIAVKWIVTQKKRIDKKKEGGK